jgi:hypothetical protein
MAEIESLKKPDTFNGPLETGLRAVALLGASYPRAYDLQRLVGLDYLLVHTGDVGGPDSLHPPAPLQSAELLVRRVLIERALLLMMTRDLIEREVGPEGIKYVAGENAATFLSSVESEYLTRLKDRAKWLIEVFGSSDEVVFRATMRKLFDHWVEEFQAVESRWGAEK